MTQKRQIRPAQSCDSESLGQLHVRCWQESYPGLLPQTMLDNLSVSSRQKQWAETLRNGASTTRVIVVEANANSDSELVGFCAFGPGREAETAKPTTENPAEIYAIYLLDAVKRRGLGRELFVHAATQCSLAGFEELYLWALSNNPARDFYARMGGQMVATKTRKIGVAPRKLNCFHWRLPLCGAKST